MARSGSTWYPDGALRGRGYALVVAILWTAGVAGAKVAPATRCAAAKLAATSRKTAAELHCHQKALLHGQPVDASCIAFASARFTAAFERAEKKGGCTVTGDAATVEAEVDAYVAELTGTLPTPTTSTVTSAETTTTTVTTSTTTTTMFCGGIAPACSGFCPGGHQCTIDPMLIVCTCN